MLKYHEVWKSIDSNTLAIYFCYENLENGKYCVQNMELYRLPLSDERHWAAKKNAMELFMEETPLSRADWAPSLQAAVELHDEAFKGF